MIKSIQEDRIDNEVLEEINQEIAVIISKEEMKKILENPNNCKLKNKKKEISNWIREKSTKINIVLDASLENRVLSFFEEYFLFKYNPIFEGKIRYKKI